MILEDALNKLLRDTMNLILGISGYAIAAKQDAPRPAGSYGDVDFVIDTGLGIEQHTLTDQSDPDLDIIEDIQGLREITMSIGFYRDNAIDNARKVRTGLIRESIQELFRGAGVGLATRSEVREISEPLENGWEERAQFDIVLSAVGSDTDIIRSILSVNIEGEFQARGLVYNFDIEVQ